MKKYKWFYGLVVLLMVTMITGCSNPLSALLGDDDTTDVSIVLEEEIQEDARETVLYFRDDQGMIIPVMKRIPWEEGIAKSALRHLVDGPAIREELASDGLLPILPEGTEVLGMSISEGLCKVDFDDALLEYETEVEEKAMLQSLVYTLTEFEAIDQVQILVNGQVKNKLKFGSRIDMPLQRENINLSGVINDGEVPVVVYYKTSGNGLDSHYVPVTKSVQAIKADIKTVLVALLEGAPEGMGLYSELPEGVVVNDVFVKDGIAYIDFSEEINRIPDNKDIQQSLVNEIGLTLKEVEPSIAQIRILSSGSEIEMAEGVNLNLPNYSNEY
ncbi:GerMN domain-containing protein [Alkaliphilus hydrothermalis]|uniref:Germination protein M n=1 Tax=Alkaliphilus hydrothermalis TaxID=1482730 RepID=A0ABS2NQF4_9FIRM|nr:GerMN domain-containing protein [Alkaliphilus hydrothermalis]MBM7615166.1 germination protein M [Alkaliphilus hydrothermalis]